MRQSELFSKTSRSVSAEEISINAKLLTQGGFIDKQMSGVYSFLPLGFKVFKKIEQIIREEINAVGGQEMIMTSLQPKELWESTSRWQTPEDIMYKMHSADAEPVIGLAWTHEEAITNIARRFINSYRDLPKAIYQFQTKFRNEPRAKSGIIRMREFVMKDLYSFHQSEADLDQYYESVKQAYLKIFKRTGLNALVVEASGGAFTKKFSHEFQVLTTAGEDSVIYCKNCEYAQNYEVAKSKAGTACATCAKELAQGTSVEVGNIFKLGTKFSEALGLNYTDADGLQKPVIMASYGIGPGRVMGTIVEVHNDEAGIIWPSEVAPFRVHLLLIGHDAEQKNNAEELYKLLLTHNVEVLYDDRDESAGIKFKDSDLIGIPWRVVVSSKNGTNFELKSRHSKDVKLVNVERLLNTISVQ